MASTISFRLNDESVRLEVDGNRRLLWVLRTELGLTGTKYGCGKGLCGSCTVLLNDRAVRSCLMPMQAVQDQEIVTIEGLAKDGELHPVQEAFVEHDALQCGFCTPGMILSACSLLRSHPRPTREQIISGLEQNLCRCGAHSRIIDAALSAAGTVKTGRTEA